MSAEPIVYLNGDFLPAAVACLPLTDLGLHGVAATEMTRTFGHRCFRLDDHLDRLNSSMGKLGLHTDLLRGDWQDITGSVVEHNSALISAQQDLLVNHLVTAGPNPAYATPPTSQDSSPITTICVQTFPLPFARWAHKYDSGQHLIVPEIRQIPANCLDPGIKSRNRLHWYLADRQARETDVQASALLSDLNGHLTETGSGNFYIVRGNTIFTPPRHATLNGVSQYVVRDIAKYLGLGFEERDIRLDWALAAEEALTSSTPYCVLPVTQINRQPIGDGKPGPVFHKILETWNVTVGMDIARQAMSGRDG